MSDTLSREVRVRNSLGEEWITVGELIRRYENQVRTIKELQGRQGQTTKQPMSRVGIGWRQSNE